MRNLVVVSIPLHCDGAEVQKNLSQMGLNSALYKQGDEVVLESNELLIVQGPVSTKIGFNADLAITVRHEEYSKLVKLQSIVEYRNKTSAEWQLFSRRYQVLGPHTSRREISVHACPSVEIAEYLIKQNWVNGRQIGKLVNSKT